MVDESYPMRNIFYPNLNDRQELRKDFIKNQSRFQDGNTVGIKLSFIEGIDTKNISGLQISELSLLPSCFAKIEKRSKYDLSIDMGNFYYCFDIQAYPDYFQDVTVYKNRQFLKLLMEKYGFIRASSTNSFQFTLKN